MIFDEGGRKMRLFGVKATEKEDEEKDFKKSGIFHLIHVWNVMNQKMGEKPTQLKKYLYV